MTKTADKSLPFPVAEDVHQAIVNVMSTVSGFRKQMGEAPYPVKLEREVIAAVRDAMISEGLVLAGTEVLGPTSFERTATTRGGKTKIMGCYQATFVYKIIHAKSGSFVTLAVPGSGSHTDDKAPYIAKTGSKKYALSDIFLLEAWDEDPDDYYNETVQDEPTEPEDDTMGYPSEKALDAYYALKSRAQSLGIFPDPISEKITIGELREEYSDLLDLVEQTEAQEGEEQNDD